MWSYHNVLGCLPATWVNQILPRTGLLSLELFVYLYMCIYISVFKSSLGISMLF